MKIKREAEKIVKGFIVLEGLDGSGTTTQMTRLVNKFEREGLPAFGTFEPTGGPAGLLIREILGKRVKVEPSTLAYLFVSDRNEHLKAEKEGILSLSQKRYVVCDRYLFSSLAYQSLECGYEFIYSLNSGFPLPEYCVFLDVPPEVCQNRISGRSRKELFEDLEIQNQIHTNYKRAFADLVPIGIKFLEIDGTLPAEEITEKIWSFLDLKPIEKV